MLAYLVRRLLAVLPLLLLIAVVAFAVIALQPGDFLTRYAFDLPQAQLEAWRARYGLDQPAWVQFGRWLEGLVLRGDWGTSFATGQPALTALTGGGQRLVWTGVFLGLSFVLSWTLALPLGVWSATRAGGWPDRLIRWGSFLGVSLPNFLLALGLLVLLVVVVQVGPRFGLEVGGLFSTDQAAAPWTLAKALDLIWHLWPPLLVMTLGSAAALVRHVRGHVLDVLAQRYITTARAKGLAERVVVYKHALRAAAVPLLSLIALWLPGAFESALVAAVIFQLPLVEGAYWQALLAQDQAVILAGLLLFSLALVAGNLLADVLLAWVDPKVRYD